MMTFSNNAILFHIPNLCNTWPLEDRPSPESIPYGIATPAPPCPPATLQSAFLAEEKLSVKEAILNFAE